MSNTRLYTFAIAKAYVSANADSTTPASWLEIPLVKGATLEYNLQESEVTNGEGKLFWQWFFGQRANIRLRMGAYQFSVLERITGSPVSSAQGADQVMIGVNEEVSPPVIRLKVICKAVDPVTNTEGYAHLTVFKAQGRAPTITMEENQNGVFEVMFKALAATYNESGASIPEAYARFDGLKTTATP